MNRRTIALVASATLLAAMAPIYVSAAPPGDAAFCAAQPQSPSCPATNGITMQNPKPWLLFADGTPVFGGGSPQDHYAKGTPVDPRTGVALPAKGESVTATPPVTSVSATPPVMSASATPAVMSASATPPVMSVSATPPVMSVSVSVTESLGGIYGSPIYSITRTSTPL